jgi:hypothetical protein
MTAPVGDGTRGWSNWREYGRLLARIVTRTADDLRLFDYSVSRQDHVITVAARRQSRDATLQPTAAVLDESGAAGQALAFHQAAPGHFTATLALDPRATVRLLAAARNENDAGRQPTRLISMPLDDVSPEQQVDPDRGLDLEALAAATGGEYGDAASVASGGAGRAAAPAPDSQARSQAWSVFRLWPLLLVVALSLYLGEVVYRRWPHSTAKVAA